MTTIFILLGLLLSLLPTSFAELSLTYPLSGFDHNLSNHTGVFAQHSMLGMLLLNQESTRYAAQSGPLSDPVFCRNFSISAESVLFSFLSLSGKSPNDLGFYDDCRYLQQNAFLTNYSRPQYSLFSLSYMGGSFKWGFCYPAQCYNTMNNTIYQSASFMSFQVQYQMVDKFEPVSETRWQSILMLTLLAFLVLLGIIGTIIHQFQIGNNASTTISDSRQMSQDSIQNPISSKEGIPKLLACFSFRLNVPRMLTRQRKTSPTDVLDGVRVLSIFWVVLGHSYFFPLISTANNQYNAYLAYTRQFLFTIVSQAVLAVDTFFFLSAFLATYILLSKLPSKSTCPIKMVPYLYLRRYYRLTPLLAFIMYFSAFVIYPLTQGPMRSGIYNTNIENCKHNGWATILYLINYYPSDFNQVCFGITWYLSIDMHLFLLLPFYVLLYNVSHLAGYITLGISLLANVILAYSIAYHYNLGIGPINQPLQVDYFGVFYTRFYVRCGAYIVGIIFAILYHSYLKEKKIRDQLKAQEEEAVIPNRPRKTNCAFSLFDSSTNSSKVAWTYLIIGFIITSLCVFLTYWPQKSRDPGYGPRAIRSLFNALERPLFVSGISLALIPLLSGRFSWIRSFLGHQFFVVLSRLTYSVYLIHAVLLIVFLGSQKATTYFTHLEAVVITFSMLVLSYIFGGVMTLLVESPLSNLDKHFFFKQESKKN